MEILKFPADSSPNRVKEDGDRWIPGPVLRRVRSGRRGAGFRFGRHTVDPNSLDTCVRSRNDELDHHFSGQ
jgi:hypothetical protein